MTGSDKEDSVLFGGLDVEKTKVFSIIKNILMSKDKLLLILLGGILLLVISLPMSNDKDNQSILSKNTETYDTDSYFTITEKKIEDILSISSDVGKVKVMINQKSQGEVEGIVIVCEGADKPKVVADVSQALTVLFGIPVNKIKILKMEE